jgi:hypothetical protein
MHRATLEQAAMARPKKKTHVGDVKLGNKVEHLTADMIVEDLSSMPMSHGFELWIVGITPLITHAWSQKAKRKMLGNEMGAIKGKGREPRNPIADFEDSLYKMGKNIYGFPATAIKKAIWSSGHKDKQLPMVAIKRALWLNAEMVRVMPALAGAICDMPLIRIYGSAPEMREDPVRVGGVSKTSTFAYRGQFTNWAMHITGEYTDDVLDKAKLLYLIRTAGLTIGIGEWRNLTDKSSGMFGAFRIATAAEAKAWDAFKDGHTKIVPGTKPLLQAAE